MPGLKELHGWGGGAVDAAGTSRSGQGRLLLLGGLLQQLHDQFMEGFADLGVACAREVQKIKHVVAGDGAIRVHEAPVHVQQLDVGEFGQGGLQKLVYLGILLPQWVWLLATR